MEISEKRLKELERAEAKLNALENYGVDNWEGYGDALTEYHQENAIDESYDKLVRDHVEKIKSIESGD